VLVASTFWDTFFLLMIWIPLITLWIFALADIFRRHDLRPVSKALWVACIIFIPYFGSFIYILSRSSAASRSEHGFPTEDRPQRLA
jgi:hypothetical protein